MRLLIFLFTTIFFFGLLGQTQTISKISGNEVTVDTNGMAFKEGETVNFIDESLNSVAKGKVKKISEGKSTIIIEMTEGKPTKSMKLERLAEKNINTTQLTQEERDIVAIGEISDTAYVFGGLVSIWPIGFGTGHAIQGRYRDKGYIFTIGEGASLTAVVLGVTSCWGSTEYWDRGNCSGFGGSLAILGVFGFFGFRIWEIIDAWAGPLTHRERYREIKSRTGADTGFKFDGFTAAGMQFSF